MAASVGASHPNPIAASATSHQVPHSAIRCTGNTNTEAARYLVCVVGAFDVGHLTITLMARFTAISTLSQSGSLPVTT